MKMIKTLFFLCFLSVFGGVFGSAFGEETKDIAQLIQEVQMREGAVTGARLLREKILITQELQKIINSGRRSSEDFEFTIIPLDELDVWATPLVTDPLKKKLQAKGILDEEGKRIGDKRDASGEITDSFEKRVRSFVESELALPDEEALGNMTYDEIMEMMDLRDEAYRSAMADAYSLSLLAQFHLADFNEKILTPFRDRLESSEDLMDRVRKNTWAVLGLASQINMSNIRSASGVSLIASEMMAKESVLDRVKRYEEEKKKK